MQNTSDVALGDVTMDVSGPLRTNGRRSRVPQLRPEHGQVHVQRDRGRRGQVPVSVRLMFTYPDGLGSILQVTQEDSLRVVAGQDSGTGQDLVAGSGGTILYLTASPNDPDLELSPLRTDLEMKKVKERLQLSKARDQYRIEFCPASEWDDLSQALVDYDPQVVHFSGHGDSDGNLLFEDAVGGVALTTPEGLPAYSACTGPRSRV